MNLSDHRRVDARNWQNEPDGMSNVTRSHFWPNEPKRHPPTYKFGRTNPRGRRRSAGSKNEPDSPTTRDSVILAERTRGRRVGRTNPTSRMPCRRGVGMPCPSAFWPNEPKPPLNRTQHQSKVVVQIIHTSAPRNLRNKPKVPLASGLLAAHPNAHPLASPPTRAARSPACRGARCRARRAHRSPR